MSRTALGAHASHHLGPIHAFMAAHGVPPTATTVLAGLLLAFVLLALVAAGLKRVFA